MAQVMVNFRMDEDLKKHMEQACKEMGLSMTAAFTIFAAKVSREKRIPFEITAQPPAPADCLRQRAREDAAFALQRRQERLEELCGDIRRTLTAIHTAIPASITGLTMERIRLLCGDELKDKAARAAKSAGALFSGRNAGALQNRDLGVLDEYLDGLSAIAQRLQEVERALMLKFVVQIAAALIPAMKSRRDGDIGGFEPYEQALAAASQEFDALAPVLERFLHSAASGAHAVRARLRKAAAGVETGYVLAALDNLEGLVLRQYDSLEERTCVRVEADYLQTLELTLRELSQAEREAGDVGGKAALCLRAVNVLLQVVSEGGQARREWTDRSLEAEVEALERLAAMRGDAAGSVKPEG